MIAFISKWKKELSLLGIIIISGLLIFWTSGCQQAKKCVGEYYSENGEVIELFYNGEAYISFDNNPETQIYYLIINNRICFDRSEYNQHVIRTCYKYAYVTNDSILVGGTWFVKQP